jgi:hypothetical protein
MVPLRVEVCLWWIGVTAGGLPNSITVPLRIEVCLEWIGVMVAVMSLDLPWKGCGWMTPRSDFRIRFRPLAGGL